MKKKYVLKDKDFPVSVSSFVFSGKNVRGMVEDERGMFLMVDSCLGNNEVIEIKLNKEEFKKIKKLFKLKK